MSTGSSGAFRVGPDADPDRYLLGAAVASGAEGILYRGSIVISSGVEIAVAIKMLQPRFLSRVDDWHARWMEQVELLRSLQIPGVVRVRDGFLGPLPHAAGEPGEGRTLYLVMNWVEGEPLDEWVRRRRDRDPFDALKLLLGVAAALDLMHSGRATGGIPVVHLDVKPSNILVSDEGTVLVDFGLTRGLPAGQRLSGVAGTPGYLPPEATEAGVYTPATDRYAFGGVSYFVLTGEEPPPEHDPVAVRASLAAVPVLAERPEALDLVMAMLDADPTRRPTSLANWVGQLRRSSLGPLAEALPPEAPTRHPHAPEAGGLPHRRRRPALVRVASVAAIVLAVGATSVLLVRARSGSADRRESGPNSVSSTATQPPVVFGPDDFSNRSSGWREDDSESVFYGYDGGAYRVLVRRPSTYLYSTPRVYSAPAGRDAAPVELTRLEGDVHVGVNARYMSDARGYFGLVCRAGDLGYIARIAPNGEWEILKGDVKGSEVRAVSLKRGRKFFQGAAAIHPREFLYRLRLECLGAGPTSVRLYVNDGLIGQVIDPEGLPRGGAGLYVDAQQEPGVEVVFDDFVISRP